MLTLVPILVAMAPAASALPGIYRSNQMEIGAGLELATDGRFRYALDYGAVSEYSEGTWTQDGATVRLTSVPMPKAPAFEIVKDDPAPPGELWINFENPGFDWGGPLEMLAQIEGVNALVRLTPDERGKVDVSSGRVIAIRPIIPVYEEFTAPIPIGPNRGHRLTLRFVRNDLGKARFAGQALAIEGDELVLNRYGATIRFDRVGPPMKRQGE